MKNTFPSKDTILSQFSALNLLSPKPNERATTKQEIYPRDSGVAEQKCIWSINHKNPLIKRKTKYRVEIIFYKSEYMEITEFKAAWENHGGSPRRGNIWAQCQKKIGVGKANIGLKISSLKRLEVET